jgi:hypothetical protein
MKMTAGFQARPWFCDPFLAFPFGKGKIQKGFSFSPGLLFIGSLL